ncbi:hypothetical protein AOL_s00043g471 [Orbilia oligospora ATCC 24927]|uniref:Uncharacterized protein n=1 Tax=Arthrobotrys oligospora (strain ATCC 24927 / CBS 115.81 / DSM 1491) TaxID=756982 RepID=G1X447_ARTOA|nr:hypothetical protein AOL_s00043g471 [Orbilia oligospora ATCC 24927]EGX52081.1 hypothetical protein AOL_s00043g471 [Orbilia oligospora ATCC 24927]
MTPQDYLASPFYPADQESLKSRRAANDPFGEKDVLAIGDNYKNTVHWPSRNETMKEKRLQRMKEVLEQEFKDKEGIEKDLTLEEVDEILEGRKAVVRAEEEKKRAEEAAQRAKTVLPIYEAKSGLHVANAEVVGRPLRGRGRGRPRGRGRGRGSTTRAAATAAAGGSDRGQLLALPTGSQSSSPPSSRRKGSRGRGGRENLLPRP